VDTSTELVIARHGEAFCNLSGIAGGERGCTGLTDRGRQQAHRLGARLAAEHAARPFHAFYAGPRLRVRQTAEAVAARVGLVATVEPALRGPDHGTGDGMPWQDIRAAFGGPPRQHPDRPYAPGSETWNQYLHRTGDTVRRIVDRHPGQRILIVAHHETIEAVHTRMLGLPPGACRWVTFASDHTGLARWRYHSGAGRDLWILEGHNDTAHLLDSPQRPIDTTVIEASPK
jgi:2,3-bisphosphoglycerate-dependent phosphoglycerate mutase